MNVSKKVEEGSNEGPVAKYPAYGNNQKMFTSLYYFGLSLRQNK